MLHLHVDFVHLGAEPVEDEYGKDGDDQANGGDDQRFSDTSRNSFDTTTAACGTVSAWL